MYFLIDECCAKGLVTVARRAGHTAQLITEVGALGAAADDSSVFQFARRSGAVLVTVNAGDFRRLAARTRYPGIVVLPALREQGQSRLFRRGLPLIVLALSQDPGHFIDIDAAGRMRIIDLS